MKRSNIFWGITTSILAVGALVAAKAAKFSNHPQAYYSNGLGKCTIGSSFTYFTVANGNPAVQVSNSKALFTYNKSGCVNRLYTAETDF